MKILFVYRHLSSFVKNDLCCLSNRFPVFSLHVSKNLMKTGIRFLVKTPKVDIIFVWLAGYQAVLSVLFAKLFRKKIVVVAGGYDAADEPEIGYGAFRTWYRAAMAIFVFKKADLVLAVSEHTRKELLQRFNRDIHMVYNGVDTNIFVPKGKKERIVLTVAAVNASNLKKKGLETFVQAASYLPNVQFVLAGSYDASIENLRGLAGRNIVFTGRLPFAELLKLYQRSKVYVQASFHESFGVALAEGMACECVPIITRRAALPEVVGGCGYYVNYGDAKELAVTISKAIQDKEKGTKARARVIRLFTLGSRQKQLEKLLSDEVLLKCHFTSQNLNSSDLTTHVNGGK